ncbi:unnamed protein product [Arctogadus glacialis]
MQGQVLIQCANEVDQRRWQAARAVAGSPGLVDQRRWQAARAVAGSPGLVDQRRWQAARADSSRVTWSSRPEALAGCPGRQQQGHLV